MNALATRLRDEDRGTVVVWVAALSMLLVVVLGAAVTIADVLAARQRAATAADLAALAAAGPAAYGDGSACRTVAEVVADNAAALEDCRVVAGEVWVSASVRPRTTSGRWVSAHVLGHDGPVAGAHAGLG